MKARKLGQEERKKDSLDLTVLAVLAATPLKKITNDMLVKFSVSQ